MLVRIAVIIALAFATVGCSGKTSEELYAEGLQQSKANPNGAIVLFKSALEKDRNHLDARYQLARAYLTVAKYEQAEREFLKVLRQNPSRSDIKLELARVYSFTRKPALAIKEAEEYLKSHPGAPAALEALGIALAISNKPEEAEGYLLQALKADPALTPVKLELAALYTTRGKQAEVRRLLDEVIKGDPNNSRAHYMLAALEASLGNRDQAIAIYRRIAESHGSDSVALYKAGLLYLEKGGMENTEKIAADLVRKFPKRAEGRRLKGLVYYYRKNFTEAILELQNSIKIQPSSEAHYFLGLSHYHRGELETALSQFRLILDQNPSFLRARLLTGMILLQQQRIDDSVAEIRKLLDVDPNYALAHNVLGSAYLAKGMYDEGIRELNRTIELDPKLVDAYLKKGLFHLRKGEEKEAETDLQTAIRIAPEILNTRMILASHYMRQNNHAKAVSLLIRGINGTRSDAPLYNYLAAVMLVQKKEADALKYLQKAKELDPSFFATHFNIAIYYAAGGDHEKALQEYQEVLRKDPQNVKAMLSMAALLDLKGRDSEAYDYYRKARETNKEVAFLALANYHMKNKQSSKALAVLDEAIKAHPRNTTILEAKGRILVKEKDFREAIKVFDDIETVSPERGLPLKIGAYVLMKDIRRAEQQARRVINLKPNSASGYMMLASVRESQNDLGGAIDEMKNGLRADGKNAQAIVMLGNLYARKKDYKSAQDTYAAALIKDADFTPAIFAQGALLDEIGKKKEAVKKYREALAKSDNYVPALNNLAYLYVDGHGSPREGLRLAFAGFKQEPENPGVMDTLGYALLKNGHRTDAQKVLEKAALLLPDNPTVAYHLALAYKETGTREQAVKTLQKSLALGDFPEAGSARKLLTELQR